MRRRTDHYYLFGSFRLDPDECRLQKDGLVVPLAPKSLAMLLMLVRNHGSLVEKDELLRTLWPDTFVEESNLTFNISVLRKALGETAHTPSCIETVPKRGYRFVAHVKEVRTESDVKSLAVLPFASLSQHELGEYFADGIQDALISELAHISSLRVISRTTSSHYQAERQSLPAFARNLQLDFAVEGSVLLDADRARINIRLVDAINDSQLWAQSYDRQLRDVLAVQSELATSIARLLEVELTPAEEKRLRNRRRRSIDPQAYAAYLKGRYYWHQFFTEAGMKAAIDYFQRAIELEPEYARAWAYLSACFTAMGVQSMLAPAEAEPQAKRAAQHAVECDPFSAEAHTSLAATHLFFDWNWPAAEHAIGTAIELNPNGEGHGLFTHYALARGWCDQAVIAQRRALDLDPMSATMNTDLIWAYLLSRDYARALELGQSAERMKFNCPLTHMYVGEAYLCVGESAKAIAEIEQAVPAGEYTPAPFLAMLGYAYAVAGKKKAAKEIRTRVEDLSRCQYVAAYDWAVLHAGSGDDERALQRLEQAVDAREPRVIWLKVEPVFDCVRNDDRFQRLIQPLQLD